MDGREFIETKKETYKKVRFFLNEGGEDSNI